MPHVPGPLTLLAAFAFGGIVPQNSWHLNWEYFAGRALESALEYSQKRPIHIKLEECPVPKCPVFEPPVCETGGGLGWSSVFSAVVCSAAAGGVISVVACRRFEAPLEVQPALAAEEPDLEEELVEAPRRGPLTRRQRLAKHASRGSSGEGESEGESQGSGSVTA